MATVTGSNGRKRPLPSSLLDDNVAPPNKSLPKATERGGDREYLHQKIAEASRNHFFLSPRHIPIYGFSSKPGYTTPPMQAMRVYPFLSHSRTIDSVNPSVRQQPDCSPSPKGGSQTPYPSPIYPSLLRYQFPPTPPLVNSPQNLGFVHGGNIGINTHQTQNVTSSVSSSARVCNDTSITTGAQDQSQTKSTVCHSTSISSTGTTSTSMPQYIFSPHQQNIHVRSPYSFYNPSPGSPMVMLPSPYASSCPSVSSSSGCSSMSEGSGIVRNFAYQGHRNVAASEYHCGVVPRIINVEDDDDEDEVSEEEEEQHGQMADATITEEGGRSVARPASSGNWRVKEGSPLKSVAVNTPSPADSDYPQSVQSQPCTASSTQNCMSHLQSSVDRPSSGISSMSSYLSSRESTPEPDESRKMTIDRTFHQPATLNDRQPKEENENDVDGSDLFCMVPGRLSLLSATQKYRITVDEVQRRLSSPECLNASVLGGILRRAKSKNGGHLLRQRLESIGVSLPPGRRKATDLSLLTSLVEGEALHLSSDFNRLCNNFFPHTELAQIIGRQHVDTPQLQERVTMVKAAQVLMTEFQGMMDAVGGPSNIRPADPDNPYPGLTNFSLITHGFGNPVISTVMSQIQIYLSELLAVYEGRTPLKSDNNSQAPNYAVNSQGRYSLGESSRTVHHCNLKQESLDETNL